VKRLLPVAAIAMGVAGPAQAACSAQNTYSYNFGTQATTTLNYANSYNYAASNPLGATQGFAVSFATNGLSSTTAGGVQMPAINALVSGTAGGRTLVMGGTFNSRTADITTNTRVIRTVLTFAQPIRDLTLTVHDIDFTSGQFRDWLMVTAASGASTYNPALTTPHGTNNGAGPRTAVASSVRLGPGTTPYAMTAAQAIGAGSAPNTGSDTGDITISFAEPVTTVTLRYGNYPLGSGESGTGQQAYGISVVSFCPMPNISVTKTSMTYATSGPDRFKSPGSDVVYTITATNNGGSPVDLGGLVLTDPLPAQVTFHNGDFDPAQPGTDPFLLNAGSSGVTLAAANVTYSNNGGTSYTYAPAAGYDTAVNAIRFEPGGSMAANSSFSISFRARIK
jgi:uncharacterized repeat protein (TIGR01451 family)